MRYGIIGDAHGNLKALETVLAELDDADVDDILCLGDTVGYGANPGECLRLTRERTSHIVAGNHDWAVADKVDTTYFNADARDSVEWTKERLTDDDIKFLAELPLTEQVGDITLVHSTLYCPHLFGYIQALYDAQLCFRELETHVVFVGHSHVPVTFKDTDPIDYFTSETFEVTEDQRLIVNVGSVGQPRDMDPRASYAIYDTEKQEIQVNRVEYDVSAAAEAILNAGLPATNAHRLQLGR